MAKPWEKYGKPWQKYGGAVEEAREAETTRSLRERARGTMLDPRAEEYVPIPGRESLLTGMERAVPYVRPALDITFGLGGGLLL
ncbi:MAG: hypothetical protein ACXABY_04110, partial [Candidatus Thorarchaeota archaeon]